MNKKFNLVQVIVLGVFTCVLAACSSPGLTPIHRDPTVFTDVLDPVPVSDSARRVQISSQTINFEISPRSEHINSAAIDVGTANASSDSNGNLVFTISPTTIQQVPTAPIGYITVTASVTLSGSSLSTASFKNYLLSVHFKNGNGLKTPDSTSVIPMYISVDDSSKFHQISSVSEQLISTSASTISGSSATHTFMFRFDFSPVEESTFSGTLVFELSGELNQNQVLSGTAQSTKLGKGINIGSGLEVLPEGFTEHPEYLGIVVQASDFEIIRNAGFNTVRIPIDWVDHVGGSPTYTISSSFFERVDTVVQQALDAGLNVVIDCHSYSDKFSQNPSGESSKLTAIWQQIATRYQNKPSRLYYELFNEPTDKIGAAAWNQIQNNLIQSVRSIDSFHTIIVTGVNWAPPESLSGISLSTNQNIIATVHFYDPVLFTHQGAEWMGNDYSVTGLPWPGPPSSRINAPSGATSWVRDWFTSYNTASGSSNPASQAQIEREFDIISNWKSSNIPVYIGEFGTYQRAPMDSRARWTEAVRKEAEKRGIPWAYWEYSSGFGAYDRNAGSWKSALLNALIP